MESEIVSNVGQGISLLTESNIWGILYTVVTALSFFFLLEEEGEKGWKRFIPIYGTYTCYKTFYKKSRFIIYVVATILLFLNVMAVGVISALLGIEEYNMSFMALPLLVCLLVALISLIVLICISIGFNISISHYYGKKGLFTFGMIFITPVFLFVLAYENRKKLK